MPGPGAAALGKALYDQISRLGYDTRIGPLGSATYAEDRTNPLTVTANMPMLPGFVRVPEERDLTPEEVTHEGSHVQGGFTGAMLSQLMSGAAGLGNEKGLIGPDEVLATLSQPDSESTRSDINVIRQMAEHSQGNPLYSKLLEWITR
jgi:hypothetical protein